MVAAPCHQTASACDALPRRGILLSQTRTTAYLLVAAFRWHCCSYARHLQEEKLQDLQFEEPPKDTPEKDKLQSERMLERPNHHVDPTAAYWQVRQDPHHGHDTYHRPLGEVSGGAAPSALSNSLAQHHH